MPFSEDHELFRESLRRFVQEQILPHVEEWEEQEETPRSLFEHIGELGFLGAEYPPEYGGGGADFWMSVVLAEELARCRSGGVAFGVIVHTDMSSPWLVHFGTEAQKRRYLPDIILGRKICALAITEPDTGSDMAALSTRAVRDGNDWVLTGAKTFITNGVNGDLYFVAARTREDGPRRERLSQFLVERGSPGFSVGRKLKKTGMLGFRHGRAGLRRGAGPRREPPGSGRTGICPIGLGPATGTSHGGGVMRLRRPAGAGGLHRVPEPAPRLRPAPLPVPGPGPPAGRHGHGGGSGQATHLPCRLLFASGHECTRVVSMAKLYATEMANHVAYHAVQMHGGYGYMREYAVERFARDYRLWPIASGTSEIMREIISRDLLR